MYPKSKSTGSPGFLAFCLIGGCLIGAAFFFSRGVQQLNETAASRPQQESLYQQGMGRHHFRFAPATPEEQAAAEKVITGQMHAFRAGDYAAATAFQSSDLQYRFASPEQFRDMIVGAYPLFANYASFQIGDATADPTGNRVMAPVILKGKDGSVEQFYYQLTLEDGNYKVRGVRGEMHRRHGFDGNFRPRSQEFNQGRP